MQSFLIGKTLYVTVAVTLDILLFVYVHSRCIANKLKKISKMSTLPPPGKVSADAYVGFYIGLSYQLIFKTTKITMDTYVASSTFPLSRSDTHLFNSRIATDIKQATKRILEAIFRGCKQCQIVH